MPSGLQHRIKLARKIAGLSQTRFAYEIGVTPRAVQNWEHGAHEPRGAHLLTISHLIGKPMEWFFEEAM